MLEERTSRKTVILQCNVFTTAAAAAAAAATTTTKILCIYSYKLLIKKLKNKDDVA